MNTIDNALASVPVHPAMEQRGILEMLPSFDGHPYYIWSLFIGWVVTTVFLTLFLDKWLFEKGRSLV